MQLSAKALALTIGVLWGGAMLFIGVLHLLIPPYGAELLMVLGSVYPGVVSFAEAGKVHPSGVLLGGMYGLVDGAIGGFMIAWVYNFFLGRPRQS